jgi:hypothetical protein
VAVHPYIPVRPDDDDRRRDLASVVGSYDEVPDPGLTTGGEAEPEKEKEQPQEVPVEAEKPTAPAYNKSSSFFDSVSSNIQNPSSGRGRGPRHTCSFSFSGSASPLRNCANRWFIPAKSNS